MIKLEGVTVSCLPVADVWKARLVSVELHPRNDKGIPVVVRGASSTHRNSKIIGHAYRAATTPGSTLVVHVEHGEFRVMILDLD